MPIEIERQIINEIDEKMAELFLLRMEAVKKIGEYKFEKGLPIFDEKRENEIIESKIQKMQKNDFQDYYLSFLKNTIDVSKKYQQSIFEEKFNENKKINKQHLFVKTQSESYPIIIERGALEKADEYLSLKRKVLVVTDSGVPKKYSETVTSKCQKPVLVCIEQGEKSKNFQNLEMLVETMLKNNFTRSDAVVAVGGGVVGDLAGFAASVYMRGVDFYNVPTTVLAQVDSSVGGKTAVDFGSFKNTVGSFYPPKAVLIDPNTLKTLPKRQVSSGLCESVKMALTFDEELFELFETENIEENIDYIIFRSVKIKRYVVENDEKESGLRRTLNFGHTIGHSVEVSSNDNLFHGECVGIGMLPMCSKEVKKRLSKVLEKLDLPKKTAFDTQKAKESILHDKKFQGNSINIIRCEKVGTFCENKITKEELLKLLETFERGEYE